MAKDPVKPEARSETQRKRPAPARARGSAAASDFTADNGPAAAPPAPAPRRPPRTRPVALIAFLFAVVAVAVLAGAVYASAPFWIPRVTPYLPAALRDPFLDPRFTALASRIQSLEEVARARMAYGNAIQDLEDERAVFSERLDGLLSRLDELDRALGSVKALVAEVQGGADPDATRASLDQLHERLNQLETMGDSVSERLGEMARTAESAPSAGALAAVGEFEARNERLSAAVRNMAGRLDRVESVRMPAADSESAARALVLAVGQLREALRTSGPYANEVAAVKALVGTNPRRLAPSPFSKRRRTPGFRPSRPCAPNSTPLRAAS